MLLLAIGAISQMKKIVILSLDYATIRQGKKAFNPFKEEVIEKIENEGIGDQTKESANLTKIIFSYENAINKAIYF